MPDRSILITGCSSGIGHDAAHGLTRAGWQVLATCRKAADVERLRAEGLAAFQLDYADPQSVAEGAAQALDLTGGRLFALFNNGAFAVPGALEDLPREALAELFQTNLFGYHDLTRQLIPAMRKRGAGRILNCSSVLGLVAIPWRGAYVASKFALEGLTDTLRLEMRGTGIHPILIEPGPITSRIRANSIPHFERWIDWKASARRQDYEAGLLRRLYHSSGPDRFELAPAAVTAAVLRALTDRNPRARYRVTHPAHVAALARRILSTRALDSFLAR